MWFFNVNPKFCIVFKFLYRYLSVLTLKNSVTLKPTKKNIYIYIAQQWEKLLYCDMSKYNCYWLA